MGKLNHPCSTEIQRSDFHQGTPRRRSLDILRRHWAQEWEPVSEERELGMALGVEVLVVLVALEVAPRRRCNRCFYQLGSRQNQGAQTGMWSRQGSKNCLHIRCHLHSRPPRCLQLRNWSQTPSE